MRWYLSFPFVAFIVACHDGSDGGDAAGPAAPIDHPSRLRVRVAVADAVAPEITVYDMADRELVGKVALAAPALGIVPSYTGETAILLQPAGVARVFSGGVSVIPHLDHIHIFKSPAQLLGPALAVPAGADGSSPAAHFGDARWSLGYAGARGSVTAFGEDRWVQAKIELTQLEAGTPRAVAIGHSGAVLSGGASGVDVLAPDAAPVSLSACPDVSRVASNGSTAAFVCRDGFVVVDADRVATAVPFPAGPARGSLVGLHRQSFMLATGAPGQLTILDIEAKSAFAIEAEADLCEATLEIGPAPYVTVLTAGGVVARYDARTRERVALAAGITAPFDCTAAVRPRLVATPERAWVTSPTAGELVEVDTVAGREARRIAIGGTPSLLAIAGLDARNADLGVVNDEL